MKNYSPNDVVVMFHSEVSGESFIVESWTEKPFTGPRMWHSAEQLENGDWVVSITHKTNRVAKITLSDDSYNKYGIAKLKPTVDNPFTLDYNDADLIEVLKNESDGT